MANSEFGSYQIFMKKVTVSEFENFGISASLKTTDLILGSEIIFYSLIFDSAKNPPLSVRSKFRLKNLSTAITTENRFQAACSQSIMIETTPT